MTSRSTMGVGRRAGGRGHARASKAACSTEVQQPGRRSQIARDRYCHHRQRNDLQRPCCHELRIRRSRLTWRPLMINP